MKKILEEKEIKTEKLYGYSRYLLIEMDNGYGIMDCESFTCFGNFYKIYQIDFDLFYKIKKQSEDKQEKITLNLKLGGLSMLPIIIVICFIFLIEFIGFNKFNLVLSSSFMKFIFSVLSIVLPLLFRFAYSYNQKRLIKKTVNIENYHHYYILEKCSTLILKSGLYLMINLVVISLLVIYVHLYTNLIVMLFTMIYLYLLTFSKNMRLGKANRLEIKVFCKE